MMIGSWKIIIPFGKVIFLRGDSLNFGGVF